MRSIVNSSKSLVDTLEISGQLSKDQLQIGLIESQNTGDSLKKSLLRLGFVTEALIKSAEQQITGSRSIVLADYLPDSEALNLIPAEFSRRAQLVPVSFKDNTLLIAIADLYNLPVHDRLKSTLDSSITVDLVLAGEREIAETIDRFYGFELSIDGIFHEIETGEIEREINDGHEYHQPVVRLVNAILSDAVKRGASDIHFEPEAGFVRIRYRVDGVLRQIRSFHMDYWAALVVRIKVLAELNITETRAPQDGHLSMNVSGGMIEFRVACMPTLHGENLVLRILDRQKGIVPLDVLGIPDDILNGLLVSMQRPEGLILITGPTGSGKTTTLYSMIAHKSDEKINVMTLEDPVEYPMSLLRQTSVNEQVKLDFGTGITSLLRQDPDVILVGEIRDAQVSDMVFRASMTGHQVYSTLHTNSAIGALARLKDLGVSPVTIGANVISIVGQRLVRKLCVNCRSVDEEQSSDTDQTIYRAAGCDKCDWQGYSGRIAVMEVLRFTPQIAEMVVADVSPGELLKCAKADGYTSMAEEAMKLVHKGVTSITEVSRVIDFTNFRNYVAVAQDAAA